MTGTWDLGVHKKIIILAAFLAFMGLAYMFGTQYVTHMQTEGIPPLNQESKYRQQGLFIDRNQESKYREQRNDISRQFNLMKQAYGQQSCEQLKMLHMLGKQGFSLALSNFLKGKHVASFGDGPGAYKKHIDSLGEVSSYTAYDGAPYCDQVTNGLVKFLDLTAPQFGLPAYDWVVSVEVGEHIPAKYEDIYLDNLTRHAKEGIVLSWAVPGQGGLSHVNNKALVDVIAQMKKRGFDINKEKGEPLRQASKYPWLKKNIHVYYRTNLQTFNPEDV